MADLTKPAEMSDELWEDIKDHFNGPEAVDEHKKYFTLGEGGSNPEPEQADLDRWYASVYRQAPDATKAEDVTHNALQQAGLLVKADSESD